MTIVGGTKEGVYGLARDRLLMSNLLGSQAGDSCREKGRRSYGLRKLLRHRAGIPKLTLKPEHSPVGRCPGTVDRP